MRNFTTNHTVYQYNELSEQAKEKAREWFRNAGDFDADCVIEDAKEIAARMGIDIDKVYYSGFWSQGDGACFIGGYQYKKGAVKLVKEYAPQDVELARIAKALQEVQRRNFYRLEAKITHNFRYYHARSMDIEVFDNNNEYRDIGEAEEVVTEALRDFGDWIYKQLQNEFDYQNDDETVEDTIIANEYEFDEDGNRA